MSKRFFMLLFSLIFIFNISYSIYSCDGNELNWQKLDNTKSCLSSLSCVLNNTSGFYENETSFGITRCYSDEYISGNDYYLYTNIKTINNTAYRISFFWDGFVVDNTCSNTNSEVFTLQVRSGNSLYGPIIFQRIFNCTGTVCEGSTGFVNYSREFKALSNDTTIILKTNSKNFVHIDIKNFTIMGLDNNLPCQEYCGGSSQCYNYLPGTKFNSCGVYGSKYLDDYCDDACFINENKICRTSGYDSSCYGDSSCTNITVNTCYSDGTICGYDCRRIDRDTAEIYCEISDGKDCTNATWMGSYCCGDDLSEYYTECVLEGSLCKTTACCPLSDNCVWNSKCYANGYTLKLSNCEILTCNKGNWEYAELNKTKCYQCNGTYVENKCCYNHKNFAVSSGVCTNGTFYNTTLSLSMEDNFYRGGSVSFIMYIPSFKDNFDVDFVIQDRDNKIVSYVTKSFTRRTDNRYIVNLNESLHTGKYTLWIYYGNQSISKSFTVIPRQESYGLFDLVPIEYFYLMIGSLAFISIAIALKHKKKKVTYEEIDESKIFK